MMKVLDLFSGTQSVRKALELTDLEYDYIGIDIYSPERENTILDLSQENIIEKLKEQLPPGWTPDVIWASPPCIAFSVATGVKGGNIYFERTEDGVKIREDYSPLLTTQYKKKNPDDLKEFANLSIKMVKNAIEIINHFNKPFIIENPYSSYIKYFLPINTIRNRTAYCAYGFDYKKPTAIFSNIELKLGQCTHKSHSAKIGTSKDRKSGYNRAVGSYQERSSVPPKLIVDIIKQIGVDKR